MNKPFPIGIYSGNSEPASANDYLNDFIKEINYLQFTKVLISDRRFNVRTQGFICDMPARAFIKCIK